MLANNGNNYAGQFKKEIKMSIKSINVRNQFKGNIVEILEGPVLSEVDVNTPAGLVTSVITTRSVKDLDLKVGDQVIAFVKSTEVSIAKLWFLPPALDYIEGFITFCYEKIFIYYFLSKMEGVSIHL